jgi:hypothetical protein
MALREIAAAKVVSAKALPALPGKTEKSEQTGRLE